jgi:hypothetical protein
LPHRHRASTLGLAATEDALEPLRICEYAADPVPAGSDVSSGTYKCTNCGYELKVGSSKNLPPCPSCGNGRYETLSGSDSKDDPYPDRKG